MLYAVRFHDRPDRAEVRRAQLAAHVDWLDRHRDTILVGGSLRVDPSAFPVGGLWIVDAPSRADVETLMRTDPFWTEGLRESVEIFYWSKAFPERKTPV